MLEDITYFVSRLDDANLKTREELTLRILKLGEEYGEACNAWIGFTGQNPRKGIYGTKEDVVKELIDCAITALVAAESIHGSPIKNKFFMELARIRRRWMEIQNG